jgi:hypothetical protein
MAIASHAVLAAAGFVLLLITQIQEGCKLRVGFHDHVTAMTAVTAARPAPGHELFAPKSHAATAAVAGNDANFGFVDELHDPNEFKPRRNSGTESVRGQAADASILFQRLTSLYLSPTGKKKAPAGAFF